ncbi:hypothetical protein EVA_19623 [gut metagenome]|uniref:Uncharacterized protein n=1 Tax=gut metagenome TaxID=749906 RepID=J9BXI3_9ZZZZ
MIVSGSSYLSFGGCCCVILGWFPTQLSIFHLRCAKLAHIFELTKFLMDFIP